MQKKTIDIILVLHDTMKEILFSFSKSRSLPVSIVKRAKIIILVLQGNFNQAIAIKVGLHYNYVSVRKSRFLQALPSLREIESSIPDKLEEEIRPILSDRKCSGVLSSFT